jgi:hypothetical protein
MSVPVIIYTVAKILAILSLVIEIGISILSLFLIEDGMERDVQALDGIFSSGMRVRNSAVCFLVLLFFIANKQVSVNELSVLASISSVCQLYATGSLVVLIAGIVVSIFIAGKRIRSEKKKDYGKKIWHSGLISALLGFGIAYFFYIP